MAGIDIVIESNTIDQFLRRFEGDVDRALDAAATTITNDIVQSFGTSPSGNVYGDHVASQPGYPPNVDTGALRASMRWQESGNKEREIVDGVEYGAKLELGIDIAPRPFVSPAFRNFKKNLANHFRNYLDK